MNDLCTSTTEKVSFFYFSGYIQMPYVKASAPCCGFVSPLRQHCPMLANGVSIISAILSFSMLQSSLWSCGFKCALAHNSKFLTQNS